METVRTDRDALRANRKGEPETREAKLDVKPVETKVEVKPEGKTENPKDGLVRLEERPQEARERIKTEIEKRQAETDRRNRDDDRRKRDGS